MIDNVLSEYCFTSFIIYLLFSSINSSVLSFILMYFIIFSKGDIKYVTHREMALRVHSEICVIPIRCVAIIINSLY